ncbi:S8 family peptidase [Streptomyces sp. NPDC002765]
MGLAMGLTSPAPATALPGAAKPAAKGASDTATHRIALITGDRVIVDAKEHVVGMERAKGRERVPVQVRQAGGHTLVVPTDAARMIASGRLDQRLFDITELDKVATRRDRKNGLKVIVGYQGTAATAKNEVRGASTSHRAFSTLNLDAVQAPGKDTPRLWHALTNGDTLAPGVAHVWFDGIRKAALDKSVPQIGARVAWAKGYTGKGVKVAVLDTGVDTDHPDLKGQVIASKNFTDSPTTQDHFGHGTHVASIVAGTGAKSSGTYKGVAPDAKILNGKVLSDKGEGDDATILAGMEWAADQGADIVNLSLGMSDTPGIDPLEAEVNKLSESKGILFAIAAGNEGEGGPQTIDSPGSAADALTVGAVDGHDKLAEFSSLGPTADGALKPDVTAPGVDITAASAPGSVIAKEVGENPPGYVTISGTSMATPHVAGTAAILKQQHPDWKFAELKAALVGSTKAMGNRSPYTAGSGRIAVDKAIGQKVLAEPASVDFPVQRWPHPDDTPVTRQLTYRNLGTKDVTLTFSAQATDPRGEPAPSGFFKLGAKTVTVPAGGKASVDVTSDTRLGGNVNGMYGGTVTATGDDGTTVRTAMGVKRETEAYDVTVKFVNRPGQHPVHITGLTEAVQGATTALNQSTDDAVTFRVPKGNYMLEAVSMKKPDSVEGGVDWVAQPALTVAKDTTVTFDLNRTRAPDITVPDPEAKPLNAMVSYEYKPVHLNHYLVAPSFSDLRLAHTGPKVPSGLVQVWSGQWAKGDGEEYDILSGGPVTKVSGTHVHHYKASEFATVKAGLGAATAGKTGAVDITSALEVGYGAHVPVEQKLPGTRTLHLSTGEGAEWYLRFDQYSGKLDENGHPVSEANYAFEDYEVYKAGRTYRRTFNSPVFGPLLKSGRFGVTRTGNEISGFLPLFADSRSNAGSSDLTSVRTTLYRDGEKVGSNTDPFTPEGVPFKVPAGDAEYTLTSSVTRSAKVSAASTRVDVSWTFHSKGSSSPLPVQLPVSTVHLQPATDLTGRVQAGRTATFPVTVEGAAAGRNLKSLTVWASYDGGRTWKKAGISHGRITVKNPAKNKGITLRAKITDKKGNKSSVSIYNAYYGR